MALELLIETFPESDVFVDQISKLVHETLRVSQTADGLNSTCEFVLVDEDKLELHAWTVEHTHVETDGDRITSYVVWVPLTKVEVWIIDGTTTYFKGILSRISASPLGAQGQLLRFECQDFNQLVEESVIDDIVTYGAQTDTQLINLIFAAYVVGIDFATHVTGSGIVFDEVSFENQTARQALDMIAAFCDCRWYVDYDKKLHYSAAGDDAPAWSLSGLPNDVDTFGYFDDITEEVDATNLVNQVFLVGYETALWFQDPDSMAAYGNHKAIVRDTNSIDIDDMEKKADGILARYKDPVVSYRLKTYKDGLRAGMSVYLSCPLYDVDDLFLINSLDVTFPVDGDPVYEIVCGGLDSSGSAAAARLALDGVQDSQGPVGGNDLVLASRGWSHDLTFQANDEDTVQWTGEGPGGAGTITCVGGQSFNVVAGNTLNMAAKTIVYLDAVVDPTALQLTTDETAAIGRNRIMIAVCWPSGVATVAAGFQEFGVSGEGPQTYISANNVAANSITANEIFAHTIEAAQVKAHTLTGDEMGFITLSGNTIVRTAASPAVRIEMNTTFLAGYSDAVTKQFYLDAADGKAYAGGGAVVLDEDGIQVAAGLGDVNKVRFMDGATARGELYLSAPGAVQGWLAVGPTAANNQVSTLFIQARPQAGANTSITLRSRKPSTGAAGAVTLTVDGVSKLVMQGTYNQSNQDIRVTGDVRVTSGLVLGGTGAAPGTNELCFNNGTNEKIKWDNPNSDLEFYTGGAERFRINSEGIDIAVGDSIHFGLGAAFWLYRDGENLMWHNSTGNHIVQVA